MATLNSRGISRMTIVVNAEEDEVEQAGKQLYKLMEVLKVTDVTNLNSIAHELALIKVAAKSQTSCRDPADRPDLRRTRGRRQPKYVAA